MMGALLSSVYASFPHPDDWLAFLFQFMTSSSRNTSKHLEPSCTPDLLERPRQAPRLFQLTHIKQLLIFRGEFDVPKDLVFKVFHFLVFFFTAAA